MNAEGKKRGSKLGLILFRNPGERIMITADPSASDEEILRALRGNGITLTIVENGSLQNTHEKKPIHATKIGILAEKSLSILREELINRKPSFVDSFDEDISAQEQPQST